MSLKSAFLVLTAALWIQDAAAQTAAADVTMLVGRATATAVDGTIRNLAKGAPVYAHEIVATDPDTYLNLKFTDQGLLLLRPHSVFQIEEYSYAPAGAAPAAKVTVPADLAITAVTPNPVPAIKGKQAFTLVGRGFKPGAVLVLVDLTHHRQVPDRVPALLTSTRVERSVNFGGVPAHWQVKVRNPGGTESAPYDFGVGIAVTAPVPAAAVTAPAPASPAAGTGQVAQRLGTGTTETPPASRALFRLVKGGLRTVTGLVGRIDHMEYRLVTPAATIGVRGTDYVAVVCDVACARDPVVRAALPPGAATEGSVLAGVYQGRIIAGTQTAACAPASGNDSPSQASGGSAPEPCSSDQTSASSTELEAGQYLLTLGDKQQRRLDREPLFLAKDPMPDPRACLK